MCEDRTVPVFSHLIADYLKLCNMFFTRVFGSGLINVLSLTHFGLAWYFVSLVSSIMSHINTVCSLIYVVLDVKCLFVNVLLTISFTFVAC